MKRLGYVALAAVVVVALVAGRALTKTYKGSTTAWLGVYTQSVDEDLAEVFELPVAYGAVINEVVDDSPAEEAGLEEDDVIIRLGRSRVTDSDDLTKLIRKHQPGDEVTLVVMRDDDKQEVVVTLGERPGYKGSFWTFKKGDDKDYVFSFGDRERPFIGVKMADLSLQLGEFFGVQKGRGALITEVIEDSPAEKAGLKAGDVIVAIGGDEVYDSEDVRDVIHDTDPGDKVEVAVMRDKRETTVSVEVGETEDDAFHSLGLYFTPDEHWTIPKIKTIPSPPMPPDVYFDARSDYKKEMKKLKKELEQLQKELKELREKLD